MLLFCNPQLHGQAIVWKKLLNAQSFGESVSMSMEAGNFILGGIQSKGNIPLIALYGNDGTNFWTRNICKTCGSASIIFSKELESGKVVFVLDRGYLFITNQSGIDIDTIINLSSILGNSLYITKVLDFNTMIVILSSYNISSELYAATVSKISTNDLKIISQDNWKESGTSFSMVNMADSSLIEGIYNSDTLTIRKANHSSQIVWEKKFRMEAFRINDMIETKDHRIFILGTNHVTESFYKGLTNSVLLALNSKGDSLWQKIYSPNPQYPQGFFFNIFYRIKETLENDFILVGTNGRTSISGSSYIKVSKINALGDIVWEHIQSIKPGINEGKDFLFDDDQNIVVVGTAGVTDYLEPERAFIMKLTNPVIPPKDTSSTELLLFPNPCNDNLTIKNKKNEPIQKIEIYGINGKYISEFVVNHSVYNLNTSNLICGMYLCKIFTLQEQIVKKFCKI